MRSDMISDAVSSARSIGEQSSNSVWHNELFELHSFRSRESHAKIANRVDGADSSSEMNVERNAKQIADFLNVGRSDLAVAQLSKSLMQIDGKNYNQLLVEVAKKELPEIEGDDRGHLLLSEWNGNTDTWDHVYVAERDQLYRIVQPGNTLEGIARDRLGNSDQISVNRYMDNIAEKNSLGAERSIRKGQALKLPYPH
jgi:hypothetical protein